MGSCALGQRGHPPPACLPCVPPSSLAFKGRRAGGGPGPWKLHQEARVLSPTRNRRSNLRTPVRAWPARGCSCSCRCRCSTASSIFCVLAAGPAPPMAWMSPDLPPSSLPGPSPVSPRYRRSVGVSREVSWPCSRPSLSQRIQGAKFS